METETPSRPTRSGESRFARELRGFGLLGLVAVLLILLLGNIAGAALVLIWLWLSRTPARALGLVQPKSWTRTLWAGILIGLSLKLVMKTLVMPLLHVSPTNETYHYLSGNTKALPGMLLGVIVGAGLGEEIIWRGFLFERLNTLLGRAGTQFIIVAISAILFGLAHYSDQRLPGVEQAIVTGAVFGALYTTTRSIWMPVVAHAAFDVTAVLLIYWNLEVAVAHSVLK